MKKNRYCAVIPAYGEETRIAAVVRGVLRHVPEVIVVDDGSPDQTAVVADQAGALVLRYTPNRGKGHALRQGFSKALEYGADAVITLDADGQHDPDEIPRFIEAYERTGIPVLIGNRMAATRDMPLPRRLTNWYMSWSLSRLMKQYVPDTQCGYRLYRTDLLPFVTAAAPRFAAESEILLLIAARGIRMDSVPVSTIYREEKSKIRPMRDTFRFYAMLWRFRHRRPR